MIGFNLDAFLAGNIETTVVVNIEHIDIISIDLILISDGILLRKYISSGKSEISNIWLKIVLIFSIYSENKIPITTPNKVAVKPI